MMETIQAVHKKNAAWIYGLIAGLFMIGFRMVQYLGGPSIFIGMTGYIAWIPLIGLGAAAALSARKANGGWLSLQEGIKTCFLVFVIGWAADTFFRWLLLNVINPGFKNVVAQLSLERTEQAYHRFGMKQEDIDKAITAQRETDQYSPGNMFMGLALFYILFFIIALIVALIVRKKKSAIADGGDL